MKFPHRMIVLVWLIQELRITISKDTIHQYLFLYCHKYACNNSYDFIWLNDKPYCLTIYQDKKILINKKVLQDSSDWSVGSAIDRFVKKLDMIEKLSLQRLKNDIDNGLVTEKLISQTYNSYFQPSDNVERMMIFYTIGYEGSSLEYYLISFYSIKFSAYVT